MASLDVELTELDIVMCLFDSARDLIEQINLVNYTDDNGDSIKNTTAYKRLIKALDNF